MADQLADLERQRTLDAITDEIQLLKRGAAVHLYRLGARLAQVKADELYRARDFASFEDYLKGGAGVGRTTAYNLIAMAGMYNEVIAERWGMEKMDAVRRYVNATPAEERPEDVFAAQLRVRGDDGVFTRVPINDASATQVEAAIKLLQDAKDGGTALPAKVRKQASDLEAALRSAGIPVSSIKAVKRKDGKHALDIRGVALDDIASLAATLQTRFGSS